MAIQGKRFVVDCREHPSASSNCSLSVSGTEEEVLEVACLHATKRHGFPDTPELKDEIRKIMKEEKAAM